MTLFEELAWPAAEVADGFAGTPLVGAFFAGFALLTLFEGGAGDLDRDDRGGDGLRELAGPCAAVASSFDFKSGCMSAGAVAIISGFGSGLGGDCCR